MYSRKMEILVVRMRVNDKNNELAKKTYSQFHIGP
jgi:hypothetical protein